MTDEDEKKGMRDAYWSARESADAAREGVPDDAGAYDSVASPADEPPDVVSGDEPTPDLTTAADFPTEAMRSPQQPPSAPPSTTADVQTSAPQPDEMKNARIQALRTIQRLASSGPPQAPAGLRDEDIAAARGRDSEQNRWDRVSAALAAAGQRRPAQLPGRMGEAPTLAEQRARFDAGAAHKQAGELAANERLLKATGDKTPDMTPYQKAELAQREKDRTQKSTDRSTALADRKRTMLSLYPEHKAEIDALTDLGDAQALQTALEGRLGRADTQAHADKEAVASSERSFSNALRLKEWEREHQNLTAEQKAQLEGIEKSDAAIDTFENGLPSVSGVAGKLAASNPKIAGALGAKGADFQSLREGTAIALARGLEGGMARPGNVEIIQHMLPEATDDATTAAAKIRHVREFVKNNREAFVSAAEQTGAVMKPGGLKPPRPAPPQPPPERPAGVPETAKLVNGSWMWRAPNGKVMVVDGD